MNKGKKIHVNYDGKLVIISFGSIGQGVLPLILRHIGIDKINLVKVEP